MLTSQQVVILYLPGLSGILLDVITVPMTHVINLSLLNACIPTDFKTAKVLPLYKKGNKNEEGNYRPVSILPVMSKIFEKVVYSQLYKYLDNKSLLYKNQSGFRTGFSTDTALTCLGDKIRFNMDNGLYTGMVLIDLQKAFDTVNHKILACKLKAIGLDNVSVNWFMSYLSDRNQFVYANNTCSGIGKVNCGVPQGSILGPLLFVIYINDMENSVNCDLYMYADDAALIVSGKSVNEIEVMLSSELESLSAWLEENKLSLHLGKTESILFATSRKLAKTDQLDIKCKDVNISSKSSVKYLGVNIDQDMSCSTVANCFLGKINGKLKFLHRKAAFFGLRERKMLCSALLQSHFDYACNLWYRNLSTALKCKFQKAQNKIVRYILNYDSRQHLYFEDFKKVNMLSVENRVDYITLCHMFNINKGIAPSYLCDLNITVHTHSTRSNSDYILPSVKTQGKRSFKYNGIKLWNETDVAIRNAENKDTFKYHVKQHLFVKMENEEKSEYVYM